MNECPWPPFYGHEEEKEGFTLHAYLSFITSTKLYVCPLVELMFFLVVARTICLPGIRQYFPRVKTFAIYSNSNPIS